MPWKGVVAAPALGVEIWRRTAEVGLGGAEARLVVVEPISSVVPGSSVGLRKQVNEKIRRKMAKISSKPLRPERTKLVKRPYPDFDSYFMKL